MRLLSENAGHVPVTGLRLGSDNDGEGAMTPKNIALEPDLLEQVGKLAQEERARPLTSSRTSFWARCLKSVSRQRRATAGGRSSWSTEPVKHRSWASRKKTWIV